MALASTLALVAGALTAVSRGLGASRPPTLTIGLLVSLTGGGDVYGPQQVSGAMLAVQQINAAGGVDGARLRLVVRDDGSTPAGGVTAMRQLIGRDGAVAVVGPSLSLVAVAADPVADRARVPVLAVSNTAGGIVGHCAHPCTYVWRDSLGEAIAVPADIQAFVGEQHPSTAAVIYVDGDLLGADEGAIAAEAFPRSYVRVVADVGVDASSGGIEGAVSRALAGHPDALFVGASFGQTAADIMAAARHDGFTGSFLGGNTVNSASTAKLLASAGVRAYSGAAWYAGNDFPANAGFVTAYQQAYREPPDQFAAQAYSGLEILADAIGRGKLEVGDLALGARRARLQASLGKAALMTPLGPFRFTSSHDVAQIVWVLDTTADGQHELAGFCNPGC